MSAPGSAPPFAAVGVVGGGAFGTALAVAACRAGRQVRIWTRREETARALAAGENPQRLPGLRFAPLDTTLDLAEIAAAEAVLWAVPAQATRPLLTELSAHAEPGLPIALGAKGLERGTLKLMSDVAVDTVPGAMLSILSGPSFATDLARGLPTAVTLACADSVHGARWVASLGHAGFRPYLSDDPIGAQVGGAVKNVLAIACGIATGLDLGDSARAALIARGFAEMSRLGRALGGKAETMAGLCGLGDLILTCTSTQSRNMSFGIELGRGITVEEILSGRSAVTEGATSATAVAALAGDRGVEMPVCAAVAAIVEGRVGVGEAIRDLLARPLTREAGHA